MSETLKDMEKYVCDLSEASEESIVATSIYNILFANDISLSATTKLIYQTKNSPQYKHRVKEEVNLLERRVKKHENMMLTVSGPRTSFLADASSTMEGLCDRDIELLRLAILDVFRKEGHSNYMLMSYSETAYTLCNLALSNQDKRFQEMIERKIAHVLRLSYLSIIDIFLSVTRLSELLFEGGRIDLNENADCLHIL